MPDLERNRPAPEGPMDTTRAPYLRVIHAAFARSGVPMPLIIEATQDSAFRAKVHDVPPIVGGFNGYDGKSYLMRGSRPVATVVLDFLQEGQRRTKFFVESQRADTTSSIPAEEIDRHFSLEAIEADFARRLPRIARLLREELDLPAPPPIPGIGEGGIAPEDVDGVLDWDPEYAQLTAENPGYARGVNRYVTTALNMTDEDVRMMAEAQRTILGEDNTQHEEPSPEDLRVKVAFGYARLQYATDGPMPDTFDIEPDPTAELHPTLQEVRKVIATAIGNFYHP